MDLNTVHKNFDTKDKFSAMLESHKPITLNKAIDILGWVIAKDKTDYLEVFFDSIDDNSVKTTLHEAVSKLDDTNITAKNTVKNIVGTSSSIPTDELTKLIIGDSDDDNYTSSSSEEDEWDSDSDDSYNFKV